LKLADQAPPQVKGLVKGLAAYRAGRFADAVKLLEEFSPMSAYPHNDAKASAVLAMAHHRLGQADKARRALARCRGLITERMPDLSKGQVLGDSWCDWLQCQLLCREAEALLQKEGLAK
jgi:hypothetical protein